MSIATKPLKYVGHPIERTEGRAKVTGAALYVDDLRVPGALYGKTLRSTIAAGRILDIEFPPSIPWNEFTIVRAEDLPYNRVLLIDEEQPVLCDGVVRHKEEPILLIAHEDRGLLEEAIRAIRVTYEEEPGIFDIGPGAVMKHYLIEHGDTAAAFDNSDVILEGTYRTGAQEHVYIEPNGFVAWWDDSGVTVHGSAQCPFYVHKALKAAFKLEHEQVNVIQETTGGGFGGKEDFPSVVAIHAAMLAKKSGRPVRLIYDRQEDMACSTKRHPSLTRIRTGCTSDGKLNALEVDFRIDGGAYLTLSPVVLSRGILHGFGPYNWPTARLEGSCHFTNSPPYGAFRGFGAPQGLFAIELHMSRLAEHIGLDPAELRRRNFLHKGDTMPTGQVLKSEPRLEELMDRALEMSDYRRKRDVYTRGGGRGIGLSTFMHGTGFTGSGEVYLASKVALDTRADGRVEVLVSSTEIGQGTETIFRQIAAEALDVHPDLVVFRQPETRVVPNSGPTVASRTCSIVGRLVQRAAEEMKQKLGGQDIADHFRSNGKTRTEAKFKPAPDLVWNDETYRGSAYPDYSWSVNVAEVAIDPITCDIDVEQMWATVDIGTVINPVLAMGQVEGGIAQAIGWATCERTVLKEGRMMNTQMTNYIIPTAADAAELHVEFHPNPFPEGAYGAKGVGELPMDGPGPAIIAAINIAANAELMQLPATPEELLK